MNKGNFISKAMLAISIVVLLLASSLFLLPRGDDFDIWWHLAYGKNFVENMTWSIDHSLYSWTSANPNWTYVTWIGSSLLYIVYSYFSFPGLAALHFIILLSIYIIYIYYLKINHISLQIWHIALFLFIPLTASVIYFKPEIFSFLFFTLCVFIYFHSKSSNKSYFYFYPFLFFIWANTHGLFVFGFFYLFIVLFCDLLTFLINRKDLTLKKQALSLAFYLVISVVAVCLNPYVINYPLSLLKFLSSSDPYSQNIVALVNLWVFLFSSSLIKLIMAGWHVVILMLFFCIIFVYRRKFDKNLHISVVVPVVLFFFIGMSLARMAIMFVLLCIFSILFLLRSIDLTPVKTRLFYFSICFFIVFSFIHIRAALTLDEKRTWLGIGYDEWVPKKEAAFIMNNHLPGPILNDYLIGGYMIWSMYPQYKVFIDPRYNCYDKNVIHDWFDFKNNLSWHSFETLYSKYGFKTVFLMHQEEGLIRLMLKMPDWKLVYFGDNAIVFIHKTVYEARKEDFASVSLAASRFESLSDPISLIKIFNIYSQLYALNDMKTIYGYYLKNVSTLYIFREAHIISMNKVISAVSNELEKISLR